MKKLLFIFGCLLVLVLIIIFTSTTNSSGKENINETNKRINQKERSTLNFDLPKDHKEKQKKFYRDLFKKVKEKIAKVKKLKKNNEKGNYNNGISYKCLKVLRQIKEIHWGQKEYDNPVTYDYHFNPSSLADWKPEKGLKIRLANNVILEDLLDCLGLKVDNIKLNKIFKILGRYSKLALEGRNKYYDIMDDYSDLVLQKNFPYHKEIPKGIRYGSVSIGGFGEIYITEKECPEAFIVLDKLDYISYLAWLEVLNVLKE